MMNMETTNGIFGDEGYVFIVAEIGKAYIQTKEEQTNEQYLKNAKELIKAAKESGADAVKFQTHTVEDEQLPMAITAPHFSGTDRYEWVSRLTKASPLEFWQEIKRYCDELDIALFSTPMSRGAARMIEYIDPPLWKVASSEILDFVLLDYIAATGKPIILSSGMSTEEELDASVAFLKKRTQHIAILHCISKYPCPPEEIYLETIPYFARRYGVPIGFSDHSLGHKAVLAAVAKGARIIEKHFSLSRDLWGSDHKVSMEPSEFKKMVEAIRANVFVDASQFGQGIKVLDEIESAFRPVFRKSLMASQDIFADTIITAETLYAMRPQQYAGGLPSEQYESVLGKRVTRDLKKYDPITEDVLASL